MLNAERFKKQILDVVEDDKKYNFAIKDDDPNAFSNCHSDISCKNCIFTSLKNGKNCLYNRFNWLLSEYKEPVKLTRFEQDVLKHLLEKTQYRFIVREKSDSIYIYKRKPKKGIGAWDNSTGMLNLNVFINLFPFIKWEDSEPTLIQGVLNNCEVVESDL
jgi:hypothetical protein